SAIFARKINYGYMYRPVLLIMAFFYMLLPVIDNNTTLANVVALAGYNTFNLLIWILLAEAARNFRLSSTAVFGMGWGMVTLGFIIGAIVGSLIEAMGPFTPQALSLLALLATTMVLFSYMFVFNENDLIELSQAGEEGREEDLSATNQRPRPFQTRCREIAAEYELSPKETEIMVLFAKGRSTPRIQEDLFLSRGTVTTHLRHIYQKMNIHDKQELLDIIEGKS
ncbi:MAG: LuxR C-terminal-related transcriptional regulator, partial [Coriobacteriales bacterium]|nr:LuxR C-terminal-related transcriptional regulator [Coriobacteriales bacterium]